MLENKEVLKNLQNSFCYKCGASLEGAFLVPISEAPLALIAHAVCPVCSAESMVTITKSGSVIMPVESDLTKDEVKDFINRKAINLEELLDLHVSLKKESLWNLMHKKEKNLEKQIKA